MLPSHSGRHLLHRLLVTVPGECRDEFRRETAETNLQRARVSCLFIIVVAAVQIAVIAFRHGSGGLVTSPGLYHTILLTTGIAAMVSALVLFAVIEAHKVTGGLFRVIEVGFTAFVLLWSVSITFAAQMTTGSITFYVASILAVGVIPLLEPVLSLTIFGGVQAVFLYGLPFFQPSPQLLIEHSINTTMFACLGWFVSRLLFMGRLDYFITKQSLESTNAQLVESNRKLEGASLIDDLTQVPNRREFNRTLTLEWKRATRQSDRLSLVFVDIDYFKSYNDNYGHVPGDECLRKVAHALASSLKRPGDFVARYGGDEFIVLLPGTGETGASIVADNLKRAVKELAIVHEHSPISGCITISTGTCSMLPDDALSPELLIIAADRSLYDEKLGKRRRAAEDQPAASD